MGAFTSAFTAGAFDAGYVVYVRPSISVSVRIGDPSMFAAGEHYVGFAATIRIGDFDVSRRLSGSLSVDAAEESARLAKFSVTPLSSVELASYDGALVSIDYTLFRGVGNTTYRRFTGRVENVDFDDGQLLAHLSARDGYQEAISACDSAAAVRKLLGGIDTPCDALVTWSDATPDASGHFSKLLSTVPGSVYIDGNGLFRSFKWDIGSPSYVFGPGQYFDGSLSLALVNRSDIPTSIDAALTIRACRLHCVEVPVSWEGVTYEQVGFGLGAWPSKTAIQSALEGLSGWVIKGTPVMESPARGGYVLQLPGGGTAAMMLNSPETMCVRMSATLYHRWYQEIDHTYRVSIGLGGRSGRDSSISEAIQSTWDASGWETAPAATTSVGIYDRNPPVPVVSKTGYEALPAPWPPANLAIDYYPDLTAAGINSAVRYVVARAVRAAAAGLRKTGVKFAREIDPRIDISSIVSIAGTRVAAVGQVSEFHDVVNFDSGDVSSEFFLACPGGTGSATGVGSVTFDLPESTVGHVIPPVVLGNWFGSSNTMDIVTNEDLLIGVLANSYGANFSDTAPVYTPQFRIIMPGIGAEFRDPATEEKLITADISISGGLLEVTF